MVLTARGPGLAWTTIALVLANLAAFVVELRAANPDDLLSRWGLVPVDISAVLQRQAGSEPAALVTLLTSQFLHTGWLHLLLNLLYLAVFGRSVEARLGHGRFLALFLVGGAAGGLLQSLMSPELTRPVIGASAGIAATIAAHLVLFPGATLGSLVPVLFFQPVENLPTLLLLLLWLVAQLLSGVASITAVSGVAWWAHLGGFAGGLVLAPLLQPRRRRRW